MAVDSPQVGKIPRQGQVKHRAPRLAVPLEVERAVVDALGQELVAEKSAFLATSVRTEAVNEDGAQLRVSRRLGPIQAEGEVGDLLPA